MLFALASFSLPAMKRTIKDLYSKISSLKDSVKIQRPQRQGLNNDRLSFLQENYLFKEKIPKLLNKVSPVVDDNENNSMTSHMHILRKMRASKSCGNHRGLLQIVETVENVKRTNLC